MNRTMKIKVTLNRASKSFDVPANLTLRDLLRTQGLWSVKQGCDHGECGNCTVQVDHRAVYACRMLAAQAHHRTVETFEAISASKIWQPLKQIFMEYGELECQYCLPGLMMATKALVESNPEPTEEEILEALSGVLCRCSSEPYPVEDILKAIQHMRGVL